MNRRTFLMMTLLYSTGLSAGKKKQLSPAQCQKIRERMEKLQARLRDGGNARQVRTIRRQMRDLQRKRFRQCR
jgi:hypothetical protein